MKKHLFIFTALLTAPFTFGQELMTVYEEPSAEESILQVNSMNYYSSNTFNNAFMDKFLFGGTITTDIKDRSLNKTNKLNSLGGQVEQELLYYTPAINPIGDERYGLVIGLSDNHLISSHLASDLFQTVFYGNANNLGDTMDFGFTHLQYLHYQKVGIGLYEKSTLSSIRLNYVIGSRAAEGRLSNTWMHSMEDTITLHLQGSGYQTDRFYPYIGLTRVWCVS